MSKNSMTDESRVLIVDDNEDLTQIIAFILKAEGYKVAVSNTLSVGFSLLNSFHPHLTLLDVNVGNEDGRELCFKIKNEVTMSSKVILMSGDETLINSSMADGYISKPFDTSELLEIVNTLLKAKVSS